MDKILITGCAGFLGSNLTEKLLLNDKSMVFGIDNFSSSTMSNLYPMLKKQNFQFIESSLNSDINVSCDYAFHLAGCGDLKRYFENKYEYILEQLKIFDNMVKYSKLNGSKLIIMIDKNIFNHTKDGLIEYYHLQDMIESLALELIKNNIIDLKIVKTSNIYGKNLLSNDDRFISKIIINALNNSETIENKDEYNYYTYIDDITNNLIKIMYSYIEEPIIELYNKELFSKREIGEIISRILGKENKLILSNQSINNDLKESSNSSFINKTLTCNSNIVDGLTKTIEYFKLMYFS